MSDMELYQTIVLTERDALAQAKSTTGEEHERWMRIVRESSKAIQELWRGFTDRERITAAKWTMELFGDGVTVA